MYLFGVSLHDDPHVVVGTRPDLVTIGPKYFVSVRSSGQPDVTAASCRASPSFGLFSNTIFRLNCSNIVDRHTPLRYRFERFDFDSNKREPFSTAAVFSPTNLRFDLVFVLRF